MRLRVVDACVRALFSVPAIIETPGGRTTVVALCFAARYAALGIGVHHLSEILSSIRTGVHGLAQRAVRR